LNAAGPPQRAEPPTRGARRRSGARAPSAGREPVRVGGAARTTIADVVAVAAHGAGVELAPEARARIAAARAVVLRLAPGDTPIYGV
jgi:hypothetical protein